MKKEKSILLLLILLVLLLSISIFIGDESKIKESSLVTYVFISLILLYIAKMLIVLDKYEYLHFIPSGSKLLMTLCYIRLLNFSLRYSIENHRESFKDVIVDAHNQRIILYMAFIYIVLIIFTNVYKAYALNKVINREFTDESGNHYFVLIAKVGVGNDLKSVFSYYKTKLKILNYLSFILNPASYLICRVNIDKKASVEGADKLKVKESVVLDCGSEKIEDLSYVDYSISVIEDTVGNERLVLINSDRVIEKYNALI